MLTRRLNKNFYSDIVGKKFFFLFKKEGGKAHAINMWSISATAVSVYHTVYGDGVKANLMIFMIF